MTKKIKPEAITKKSIKLQNHLGLAASMLITTFIILKVYAVAGWDATTARGLIAATGTTNVVVGSLIASLPIIYWSLFIFALPRIERKLELKSKTSVEKYAILTHSWPIILLMFIVPLFILLAGLALLTLIIIDNILTNKRKSRNSDINYVSKFEANTIMLSSIALVIFTSLGVPWLPAQAIDIPDDGVQVGYVLNSGSRYSEVLLEKHRKLVRVSIDRTDSAKYCNVSSHWVERTIIQAIDYKPKYPSCAETKSK